MATVKEISVLLDKKYSANYNSVSVSMGAVISLDEKDDPDFEYEKYFKKLDELTDEKVQKLLDEM